MSPSDRRAAIVSAALEVAVVKGLASTTVRDVAATMGTSSGLIHHYFESMDDVLAAAFEQVARQDLDLSARLMARAPDPVAALRTFFVTYTPSDKDWAFQLWLDAWAEAARRPGHPGDLAPAQSRVAGAPRVDDQRGRVGRHVLVRRPAWRCMADPVAARRAGAAGRGPRNDDLAPGRRGVGRHRDRGRTRAGGRLTRAGGRVAGACQSSSGATGRTSASPLNDPTRQATSTAIAVTITMIVEMALISGVTPKRSLP